MQVVQVSPSLRRGSPHGPNCSFDHGHSQLQYMMADVLVELVLRSSADVEETVELPQLHSLWFSSCGPTHHRVDELMG